MTGQVTEARPWLEFDLGGEQQVLSWAVHRPGLVRARRILWREVRNADLTPDLDVADWLDQQLTARGAADAVTFLTSRDVRAYRSALAQVGTAKAQAVATVGLSNAERIGQRVERSDQDWGTINVALTVSVPLSEPALLETLSLATQARTVAVVEAGRILPTGIATGTGTDCIAVASPPGTGPYAGMHTEVGEAVGRAVYEAVRLGIKDWMAAYGVSGPGPE